MYFWTVWLTEAGDIKNYHKEEVDKESIIARSKWAPRIIYGRNDYGAWESKYMQPYYIINFFCEDTDIDIILRTAWDMWEHAPRYQIEQDFMRWCLEQMVANSNIVRFLLEEALYRWEWLREPDSEYLTSDLADWKEKVTEQARKFNYNLAGARS